MNWKGCTHNFRIGSTILSLIDIKVDQGQCWTYPMKNHILQIYELFCYVLHNDRLEGSLSTFEYPLPNTKTQNQKFPYKGEWNTFPWDDRKNTQANLVSINYHHRQGEEANRFAHHQYPALQEKKYLIFLYNSKKENTDSVSHLI